MVFLDLISRSLNLKKLKNDFCFKMYTYDGA